jgi:FkbM family methyltransferase
MKRAGIIGEARFYIRAVKARFRDQKAELLTIRQHVRPHDTVCDIGANKGSFVYWLSRWCPAGAVIAFEPQQDLVTLLGSVCRRLKNVTIEPKAVYSRSGTFPLYVPPGHSPGASLVTDLQGQACVAVAVPTISLDEYFAPGDRVSLLKIDVEGAELDVFKGADRILREQSPLVVFECENRHLKIGTVHDVFSHLTGLGYEGRFICGDRLLPIAEFDSRLHQPQTGDWFWKRAGYCNNFIFSKSNGDSAPLN